MAALIVIIISLASCVCGSNGSSIHANDDSITIAEAYLSKLDSETPNEYAVDSRPKREESVEDSNDDNSDEESFSVEQSDEKVSNSKGNSLNEDLREAVMKIGDTLGDEAGLFLGVGQDLIADLFKSRTFKEIAAAAMKLLNDHGDQILTSISGLAHAIQLSSAADTSNNSTEELDLN